MFLAILAVFITFLERKLEQSIETPEIFIWSTIMLKTFKGWFTVTVFIANGAPNDFYIGSFFLFTTLLGAIYFEINDLRRPNVVSMSDDEENLRIKIRCIRDKVLMSYLSTQEGYGYRLVAILTVIFFLGLMLVTLYSPQIPEELLGFQNATPYEASAIGFSSVILVLYNAILWPDLKS